MVEGLTMCASNTRRWIVAVSGTPQPVTATAPRHCHTARSGCPPRKLHRRSARRESSSTTSGWSVGRRRSLRTSRPCVSRARRAATGSTAIERNLVSSTIRMRRPSSPPSPHPPLFHPPRFDGADRNARGRRHFGQHRRRHNSLPRPRRRAHFERPPCISTSVLPRSGRASPSANAPRESTCATCQRRVPTAAGCRCRVRKRITVMLTLVPMAARCDRPYP